MTTAVALPSISLWTSNADAADESAWAPPVEPHPDDLAAAQVYHDPEQFLALYERHYSRMLAYIHRLAGDRDVAEDLTSATFLKACEELRRRPFVGAFVPWLYRVATNQWHSHGRRGSLWQRLIEPVWRHGDHTARPTPRPDVAATQEEEARVLREELARLPEAYRVALVLRFDEELSHRELAAALGIREGSARARVSRGLELLRERMERRLGTAGGRAR